MDGARLMNAAVALGIPAAHIASLADTATLCLSKGLGCPLGAVLAGSAELIARARVEKHRFGGAMRQAGIVAAAGLYALDHNVERLAAQVDVGSLGLTSAEAIQHLAAAGVGLSGTVAPGLLRAVTHLDIGDDDVARAIELVPAALDVLAPA